MGNMVEINEIACVNQVKLATKDYFVSEFNTLAAKTAKATLEMCRVVYEAKVTLKSEFADFCKAIGRDIEDATIRKYLAIGVAYPRFIQYTDRLPNSWTSIYLITQMPPDKFDELVSKNQDLSNLTGQAIKKIVDGDSSKQVEIDKKVPSALIYFKKEPTVPQWNYFRVVINRIISECQHLDLYSEVTPKYKKLIKDMNKHNREMANMKRKSKKEAQKQVDERDVVYRPDLFEYGDSFDKEKGDFVD